jgi:hypothetical protein
MCRSDAREVSESLHLRVVNEGNSLPRGTEDRLLEQNPNRRNEKRGKQMSDGKEKAQQHTLTYTSLKEPSPFFLQIKTLR